MSSEKTTSSGLLPAAGMLRKALEQAMEPNRTVVRLGGSSAIVQVVSPFASVGVYPLPFDNR